MQIKYIKAEGTAGERLIEQIDYQYDAKGQRTAKSTLNNNGVGTGETPMTASYDAANRMNAVTLSIGGSTKTYSLSYDANGNLTQKQNNVDASDSTTYIWDANDRLVQIVQSGQNGASLNASFSYDVFGRRIQSTITRANQSPATVQYLYEGAQALGEIRDGRLSHRLLTGLSLDETIARIAINANGQKDAVNSRIYLTDALNSVIAQLGDDDNANIANSYGYSPYGQSSTVGPDAAGNPVQYTSRENDAQGATGLYYYRARYYDPVLKRFVSEDPIGLQGGMNFYGYVDGDPVSLVDPEGLAGQPGKNFGKNKPLGPIPDPIKDAKKKADDWNNPVDLACLMGLRNCQAEKNIRDALRCKAWDCRSGNYEWRRKRDQCEVSDPKTTECKCVSFELDPDYKGGPPPGLTP